MQKFFIQTFGCQMNVYDGQRIANMLEKHGLSQTDNVSDADLIILNTCSVRAKATDKVFPVLVVSDAQRKIMPCWGLLAALHANLVQMLFAGSRN